MTDYAAVDLGATSGRVVRGSLDGGRVELEEVHRFANRPVRLPDGLRWNLLHLFTETLDGLRARRRARGRRRRHLGRRLRAARRRGPRARPPLPLPRRPHRRDDRARVRARAGRASCTPPPASRRCRSTPSSSCSPTRARRRSRPRSGSRWCPTCSRCWLCGELANERTNASTTGLLDARSGEWATRADRASSGCRTRLFGAARRARAPSSARCSRHHDLGDTPVYAVASHDTASAFAAAPVRDEHAAILSSGTWSLLGLELPEPVLSDAARDANLTNERGVDGTTRLLKNVMGLWLLAGVRAACWDDTLVRRAARGSREDADRTCRCSTPTTTRFLRARRHARPDRRRLRAQRPARAGRRRRDRAQHPRLARLQVPLGARAARGGQRPRRAPHPRDRRRRAQRRCCAG